MELILNEFSLDGQFQSLDDFADYVRDILAPFLDIVVENQIPLLKKSDFYALLVMEGVSLNDLLFMSNEPAISVFKSYLVKLGYCEPYWDSNPATKPEVHYRFPAGTDAPNCFTETMERNGKLVSVDHKDYREESVTCFRNEQQIEIVNLTHVEQLLKEFLQEDKMRIRYILERYPYQRPVRCAEVNGRCYAEEALCCNDLTETDLTALVNSISRLIEDLDHGRKSDLWDKLQEDIFEMRMHVSRGRIFRLLFVQEHGMCFLNGFIKKTQKTPPEEIRKALDIRRQVGSGL